MQRGSMSDLPDLKMCGYCGAKPEIISGRLKDPSFTFSQVVCSNVDCPHQPSTDCYSGLLQEEIAISAWNYCDIHKTKNTGLS